MICSVCVSSLPEDGFYKSNSNLSGFQSWCKKCNSAKGKDWKAKNKQRQRAYDIIYRATHKVHLARASKKYNVNLKLRIINAYGGKCFCCGESRLPFLTIEHKNNDGNKQRKTIGKGQKFYLHLMSNNFPDYNLGVLCWNCNCARRWGKICPHEEIKVIVEQEDACSVLG